MTSVSRHRTKEHYLHNRTKRWENNLETVLKYVKIMLQLDNSKTGPGSLLCLHHENHWNNASKLVKNSVKKVEVNDIDWPAQSKNSIALHVWYLSEKNRCQGRIVLYCSLKTVTVTDRSQHLTIVFLFTKKVKFRSYIFPRKKVKILSILVTTLDFSFNCRRPTEARWCLFNQIKISGSADSLSLSPVRMRSQTFVISDKSILIVGPCQGKEEKWQQCLFKDGEPQDLPLSSLHPSVTHATGCRQMWRWVYPNKHSRRIERDELCGALWKKALKKKEALFPL